MDPNKEKKWYLYITDHHEGPFSVEDIRNKIALEQIGVDHYIWMEGMSDWKKIKEVGDFSATDYSKKTGTLTDLVAVVNRKSEGSSTTTHWTSTQHTRPTSTRDPASNTSARSLELQSVPIENLQVDYSRIKADEAKKEKMQEGRVKLKFASVEETKETLKKKFFKKKYLFLILLVTAVFFREPLYQLAQMQALRPVQNAALNGTRVTILKLSKIFPVLKSWVLPIPNLEGVTPEEMKELNVAANSNLLLSGGQVAIALHQSNIENPKFYVSANLPNGASIDVYIQGETDTLLNAWSFNTKLTVKIKDNWGMTDETRAVNSQAIPRGFYKIYATESRAQSPDISQVLSPLPARANQGNGVESYSVKLFSQKRYFLGGKKDNIYAERLKEFHDKLAIKTKSELNELRGFMETLESQLGSTVNGFAIVQKGKMTSKKIKSWMDFHSRWSKLTDHLNGTFSKWDIAKFKSEKFYSALYKMTQDLGQAITDVHETQNRFFSNTMDRRLYDAQLQQKVDETKALVLQLKLKISQAERMPLGH